MDSPNIPPENRRVNMVSHRSFGGSLQRKPLADCTNSVSKSSQQTSSSCAKYANPSLNSSLKTIIAQTTLKETTNHVNIQDAASENASRSLATNVRPVTRRISADLGFPRLVDQTMLKDKINDVNTSDAAFESASRSLATNFRSVTRRMSADLGFPASAPAPIRPQNSLSNRGVDEKEFSEPYSVYSARRRASGKKRNREASSSSAVTRLRMHLISSSGKKTHQANENKPKPPKKRQRRVKHEEDKMVDGSLKDYIEQQRAYFAEVDAFELPEEELTTSSSDLDLS